MHSPRPSSPASLFLSLPELSPYLSVRAAVEHPERGRGTRLVAKIRGTGVEGGRDEPFQSLETGSHKNRNFHTTLNIKNNTKQARSFLALISDTRTRRLARPHGSATPARDPSHKGSPGPGEGEGQLPTGSQPAGPAEAAVQGPVLSLFSGCQLPAPPTTAKREITRRGACLKQGQRNPKKDTARRGARKGREASRRDPNPVLPLSE